MNRFVAWLAELAGTAIAGPGATVIGDPGLVRDPSEAPTSPWLGRLAGLLLMTAILLVAGLPLQALPFVGLLVVVFMLLDRRARRHSGHG